MSWVEGLGRKLSRTHDVMKDSYGDLCSTGKACMLRDQHRTFAGCDGDSEHLPAVVANLVLFLVTQELQSKSNIGDKKKMKAAANVFEKERAALLANIKAGMTKVSPRVETTQVLPGQTLHTIILVFGNHSL